ncbi:hypothetical protein N4P33_29380 [Streptomyces sp. 15-116A]|uniref:hypothetical protein n=1 Tax=Streptomyces sp. 15-116A TaxID=2259035 RepID=UPI0021B2221E|nr:hypothetical protein [Streptomyces sp. 15-116A]MCT7356227.1 hypothetical protein [Streptomyces sp. 15-116A]
MSENLSAPPPPPPGGHRRWTVTLATVTAGTALAATLAGCGGDGHRTTAKPTKSPSVSTSPAPTPSDTVGALPDAYDFTPDPSRVPRTAAQARTLTRNASLAPADWTPGMVRHDPYETAGTWPVLPDSCVWTRGELPDGVLDSYTRRIDMPAKDGKGRVLGTVTVSVHRDERHADREMKDTVQESFRCPVQDLGGGQKLSGLQSMHLDPKDVKNADATLFEAGTYKGREPGGPWPYVWTKSRIGPVTTAVSVKGAKGYDTTDLIRFAAEAAAKLLYRVELELK